MPISDISIAILIMTIANYATRAFPFLFFQKQEMPSWLGFIGEVFPGTIMTILVIYSVVAGPDAEPGWHALLAVVFTAALHLWRNNYLLSILGGTGFFMALAQSGVLS